ncbi:hypothetical protein [Pontibacillus salipaludis]|uniref:Uncharacterized protein n=1 Tax=Pontibacillus salipaludis TaxID=1697394 RepID=A0ABQ1Q6X1_9BACI|nr:hypothetical protein [Pontibacillus salipaludis]GGD15405.1 hypothetical protein GCM10011389_23900 [Pontibacillus salipaludis]
MTTVVIINFTIGMLLVGLALYRGREVEHRQITWLSYLSLGVPILLFMLMYLTPTSATGVLLVGLPIGTFVSLICSIVALFKMDEKKLIPSVGLFLTLILTSVITMYGIFLFTPLAP